MALPQMPDASGTETVQDRESPLVVKGLLDHGRRSLAVSKAAWNVDAKRIKRLETVVNSAIRIRGLLGFGWLVSR